MADTLSLAAVVDFVIARGGSVRLIGDDQQLAAIGAGGVLRDIAATHGALHLSELMRFTDPAEGAASLALRDGHAEALGFYLDHDRVHVGDLATITDRRVHRLGARPRPRAGLDHARPHPRAGRRAQPARPNPPPRRPEPGAGAGPGVPLADGNTAHVGDLVITRDNDRRLRISATDWVKNGDRWTVRPPPPTTGRCGSSTPAPGAPSPSRAEYVAASAELGYATTDPRRPRRLRRHHATAWPPGPSPASSSTRCSPAARCQPRLPPGRRRRRPAHRHPPREPPPRPTATDLLEQHPGPRRLPRLGHHHAAATRPTPPPAWPTRPPGTSTPCTSPPNTTSARSHRRASTPAPTASSPDITRATRPGPPCAPTSSCSPPTAATRSALPDRRRGRPGARHRRRPRRRPRLAPGRPHRHRHCRSRRGRARCRGCPPSPKPSLDRPRLWGTYLTARADLRRRPRRPGPRPHATSALRAPAWVRHGQARPAPGPARRRRRVAGRDRRPRQRPPPHRTHASRSRPFALLPDATRGPAAGRDRSPALAEWGHLAPPCRARRARRRVHARAGRTARRVSRAGIDAHRLLAPRPAEATCSDDHAAAALWWRISRHLSPAVAAQRRRPSTPSPPPGPPSWHRSLGAERARAPAGQPVVADPGHRRRPRPRPRPPPRHGHRHGRPSSTRASTSTRARPWCGACPC